MAAVSQQMTCFVTTILVARRLNSVGKFSQRYRSETHSLSASEHTMILENGGERIRSTSLGVAFREHEPQYRTCRWWDNPMN